MLRIPSIIWTQHIVLPVRNRYLRENIPSWIPLDGYTSSEAKRRCFLFVLWLWTSKNTKVQHARPEITFQGLPLPPRLAEAQSRTDGLLMEKPARQLLLSELRVRNTAYDVSLCSSLLTWKRRVSSPVYHPFKPSKSCLSPLRVNAARTYIAYALLSARLSVSLSLPLQTPRHRAASTKESARTRR